MNRLQFLKSVSVGIAAAVITPKKTIREIQLNPAIEEKIEKIEEVSASDDDLLYKYFGKPTYYEIANHKNIAFWDVILAHNEELYMITCMGDYSNICMEALDQDATPIRMQFSPKEFDEQEFLLIQSGFKERHEPVS